LVALYHGFQSCCLHFLAGQQAFQYLFQFASVRLNRSYLIQLIWSI
jgi:hypothetical protein